MTGALGRKKKAELECDCCGGCPGCCFPLNEEETDFLPIPFCLDAPSCPALDGICDEFVDAAIEPQEKECGSCGSFDSDLAVFVPSIIYQWDGVSCDPITGAGLTIRFQLLCGDESGIDDDPDLPECCRRLRLICGTDYETVGSTPDIVLPDLGPFITVIEPTSCSCIEGLSAVFSLCQLAIKPQTNPVPECPFTPGMDVPECDLCAVDLVI